MDAKQDISYLDAGYNSFFNRSIGASAAQTLSQVAAGAGQQEINFDNVATGGNLGDHIKVGTIFVDGRTNRIYMVDESGNEVVRIGRKDG